MSLLCGSRQCASCNARHIWHARQCLQSLQALYRLALQLQYVPSLPVAVVIVVHHTHLLCKITKKESPFKGFQMN